MYYCYIFHFTDIKLQFPLSRIKCYEPYYKYTKQKTVQQSYWKFQNYKDQTGI